MTACHLRYRLALIVASAPFLVICSDLGPVMTMHVLLGCWSAGTGLIPGATMINAGDKRKRLDSMLPMVSFAPGAIDLLFVDSI